MGKKSSEEAQLHERVETKAWIKLTAVELEKWTDLGICFESELRPDGLGVVMMILKVLVFGTVCGRIMQETMRNRLGRGAI